MENVDFKQKAIDLIKLCEDENYFKSIDMFDNSKITALEFIKLINGTMITIPHTLETKNYYIELENELLKMTFEDYNNFKL
jgi:hypothetical protein